MKKLLPYILILIISIGIFSPTMKAWAQTCAPDPTITSSAACTAQYGNNAWIAATTSGTSTSSTPYQLLAPLPNPDNSTQPLSTFDPNATNNPLSTYLNLIIKLIIGISAALAVVMIVVGGMQYMTSELISNKEAGKEKIEDALLGLLIALGAWALLNTINPNLLNTNVNIPTATVNVNLQNDNVPQTPVIVNGQSVYKVGTSTYAYGSNLQTDFPQATYPTLVPGLTVCGSLTGCSTNVSNQCVSVGEPGCTSTLGLNATLVNSIENGCTSANNGNSCPVSITGGTEFWEHNAGTDHQPGSQDVDLSATTKLNSYLTGGATSSFPAGNVVTDTKNSACYYAEPAGDTPATSGQHWHVYPLPSSGQC